jgi:hypothetical protein
LDLVTDPNVPVMTALLDAVTGEVVTVNFAVSAPAGTVTEVGTRAIAVFEDLSWTWIPPAGAGALRETVPVPFRPPVIDAGLSASEVRLIGFRVSVAERDEPPNPARIVSDWADVTA